MKTILYTIPVLVTVLLLGLVAISYQPNIAGANVATATNIGFTATTSAATSVTASTRVLATTSNPLGVPGTTSFNRAYASICVNSATPVALNLDSDKPASTASGQVTTFIASAAGYNSCYEITDRNLYNGSITASSTAGAVTVYVKDYVQ